MNGEKMREIRKARHMTQEEIAERIGVRSSVMSRYETGTIDPTVGQLQAIAAVLGVSVADLLDEPSRKLVLPPDIQQVVDTMFKLNAEGRERVVQYVSDLDATGRYTKNHSSGLRQGEKEA